MVEKQIRSGSIFLAAPNTHVAENLIDTIVQPTALARKLSIIRMPRLDPRAAATEIMKSVAVSDMVVGLTAGRNMNVFWELGLAYAHSKPMILLALSDREFGILKGVAKCIIHVGDIDETSARLGAAVNAAILNARGPAVQ